MNIYQQNKDFYNQPIRLSPEQINDPAQVLNRFFSEILLYEVRQHLADLLEVAMTSENHQYEETKERKDALFFNEKIEELIEAAYVLISKSNT